MLFVGEERDADRDGGGGKAESWKAEAKPSVQATGFGLHHFASFLHLCSFFLWHAPDTGLHIQGCVTLCKVLWPLWSSFLCARPQRWEWHEEGSPCSLQGDKMFWNCLTDDARALKAIRPGGLESLRRAPGQSGSFPAWPLDSVEERRSSQEGYNWGEGQRVVRARGILLEKSAQGLRLTSDTA
jgi:hypothetical protein